MLTRAPIGRELQLTGRNWPVGIVVGLALAGVLGYSLIDAFGSDKLPAGSHQLTADVSDSIFSTYLVPFEVVSVLLLAALVGAIVLARKE
jgi:NADH-quinone oxidoreductase subunit J